MVFSSLTDLLASCCLHGIYISTVLEILHSGVRIFKAKGLLWKKRSSTCLKKLKKPEDMSKNTVEDNRGIYKLLLMPYSIFQTHQALKVAIA